MERPLVSVLTPTYQRHDLLLGLIANVKAQDYPNVEHVIVADGPDPELRHELWAAGHRPADLFTAGGSTRLKLVELGYNTSTFFPDSYCAGPNTVASLLARGAYQAWWSDDERAAPHYLTTMIDALEATGADFAYPRVAYHRWDAPGYGVGIGSDPPKLGAITTVVYRTELLKRGLYLWNGERESDWKTIKRWMDAGACWAFVDQVLFSHRDDRGCPPEQYAAPLPPEMARVG
jgi:hypothetical protein